MGFYRVEVTANITFDPDKDAEDQLSLSKLMAMITCILEDNEVDAAVVGEMINVGVMEKTSRVGV